MTPPRLGPDWWIDGRAVARHLWTVVIVGVLFMGWFVIRNWGRG